MTSDLEYYAKEAWVTNLELSVADLLCEYTTLGIQGITVITSCITSMQRLFILVISESGTMELRRLNQFRSINKLTICAE
jgi:hypothetical protein